MSDRLSLGPVQVTGLSLVEVNDALRQLQDRIDTIHGLRGRAMIYDRAQVTDPTVASDAMTLGTFNTQTAIYVTLATAQTISGMKTFSVGQTFTATVTLSQAAALKYTDTNGQLLHGFGNL